MKSRFFLLLISIIFAFNSFGQKDEFHQFGFNDTAYIKIIANNIIDTLIFESSLFFDIPFMGSSEKEVRINKAGAYYLNFETSLPGITHFYNAEDHLVFLIPKDTIVIHVGFEPDKDKKASAYFKPQGIIQEYYQNKKKKLGYYTFMDGEEILPIKEFFKTNLSLNEYIEVIGIFDSLVSQSRLFLGENSKNLPEWFIDVENADITYSATQMTMHFFSRLNKAENKDIFFGYPELYDPKAVYSRYYYSFLYDYFFIKTLPIATNKTSNYSAFVINQIKSQKPLIDSVLSGEVKRNYITYKLSNLYYFNKNKDDVNTVDSFINAYFPDLTNAQLKFLKSVRNKYVKSSLPKGNEAPEFYLKDINEKFHRLSDFKGKLVYLHFWSIAAIASKDEITELNKLYSKLSDKRFEIIHICLDDKVEKWKQIIEIEKFKGINLICKGNWEKNLKNAYFIDEIPHYALIDKDGTVLSNKSKRPNEIYPEILGLLNNMKL